MTSLFETDNLIRNALKEDMPFGDVTTEAIVPADSLCSVEVISKDTGILAGIDLFERVFILLGNVKGEFYQKNGAMVGKKELIGKLYGSTRSILSGERTALNILQRMSGIATHTKQVVDAIAHTHCELLDTRKTTPNFRLCEKAAVLLGGGHNHRQGLSDGVLIKDNHIMAAGGIENAVRLARSNCSFVRKIEVETENLAMVKEALAAKADIIMLDNMSVDLMREAVALIDQRALVEASGNITLENARQVAETGVDFISMGSIIYHSKVLDISMKNLKIN